MEYQKRLLLIQYIKANFDLLNRAKNKEIFFYFNNYEDLDQIRFDDSSPLDPHLDYFQQRRSLEVGVCAVYGESDGRINLYFEDAYLSYEEELNSGQCLLNDIQESYNDPMAVYRELDQLIKTLNGEQPPQRIFNC
jgi:hypothetical protein